MDFFWLVGLFFGVGVPAAAFVALTRTGRLRAQVARLEARAASLERAIGELRRQAAPPPPEPATEVEAAPEPEPEPEPTAVPAAGSVPSTPRRAPPPLPPRPRQGLEERFASRWLVWLGGATIALGGGFLVKYSVDNDLLGPLARIVLGLLLSLALIAGGEWLRRRPLAKALAALQPSYVPAALTAAGLAAGFASVYAAYALYGLVSPLVAFLALAGFAAAGIALSFLQGQFIAVLGFLGGVLAPALVATGEPRAELLFPYSFLVEAGFVGVLRYLSWPRIGWLALAGGAFWPLLWLAAMWTPGDAAAVGGYALALFALFLFAPWRGASARADARPFELASLRPFERQLLAAGVVAALLAFAVLRVDDYGSASIVVLLLLCGVMLFAARREPAFDALPILAAVVAVLAIACWHLPRILEADPWIVRPPVVPPELRSFLSVAGAFALLFGGFGFAALWGARRPGLWAGIAAAAPLAILAAAYWRVEEFETDLAWAAASLAAAVLYVIAAERVGRWRANPGMADALGAFAAAATAAVAFAAAASLEDAWLTVALAAEVLALAWLDDRLRAKGLRECAGVLAATVLVRLVLNPGILDYPLGATPGLSWLLYGYGLPALAFFLAARLFRRNGAPALADVLECGALAFAALLVTLEIRDLMRAGGRLDWPGRGLPEASLQTLAWLAIASGLHRAEAWGSRLVTRWGWRVLGCLAAAQLVLVHLLVSNPFFDPFEVGAAPVLNWLLVAYGAPAALLVAFGFAATARGERRWARAAFALALVLLFAEVSLEVRRAFHGSAMRGWSTDAEWWAYSAAWLVYAGVLLALAIRRGAVALRYASLGLVMLTVAKVFLFDMSALTGLWRALSFLGLGLSLVAVGWLYQRFIFPPKPAAAPS